MSLPTAPFTTPMFEAGKMSAPWVRWFNSLRAQSAGATGSSSPNPDIDVLITFGDGEASKVFEEVRKEVRQASMLRSMLLMGG